MGKRKPLVTVVVLNWNGRRFLEKTLPALERQDYRPMEVVVVDNASTDGSADYVRKNFGKFKVIRNKENLGFAKGMNRGLRAGRGRYVMALTNDISPSKNCVGELVKAIESNPANGIAIPLLMHANSPNVINGAGITVDRAGYAENIADGEPDEGQFGKAPAEVFGAYGGATLFRKGMLGEIGYFEEAFEAYIEDVELSWRARAAGWKTVLAPRAKAFHEGSNSYGKRSFKAVYLGQRNRVLFALSSFPPRMLLEFLVYFAAFELPLSLFWLAKGDLARVKGRMDGFLSIPFVLGKRKRLSEIRRVSDAELENGVREAAYFRKIKALLGRR